MKRYATIAALIIATFAGEFGSPIGDNHAHHTTPSVTADDGNARRTRR